MKEEKGIEGAKNVIIAFRKYLDYLEEKLDSKLEHEVNYALLAMLVLDGQLTKLTTDFGSIIEGFEKAGVIKCTLIQEEN